MQLIEKIASFNLLDLMTYTTASVNNFADKIGIPAVIFFWSLVALAFLIGMGGLHLSKTIIALGFGGLGYFIGTILYGYLCNAVKFVDNLPAFVTYIVGGVFALLFFILSQKKPIPVLFVLFAAIGAYVSLVYISNNLLLAVGLAFLIGVLCVTLVKLAMVLFTSLLGGFAMVAFLGRIFSSVTYFALGRNTMALWVALGVSAVFALIQFVSTRRYTIR
jgi:hypothetical protein